MKTKLLAFIFLVILFLSFALFAFKEDNKFVVYEVNLKKDSIHFYLKDDKGNNYSNFLNLKNTLMAKNKKLIFATNGGMYNKENNPQGLYIEKGKIITKIDTTKGSGNFYLKPNGIFYIRKNRTADICITQDFKDTQDVLYATQSGPMLLIDGKIHPAFSEKSQNTNIRNGVGILPNGNIIFVMSKEKINFYQFAVFFKKHNCKNALYLDGFVSRAYLPEKKWVQVDGNFGVIIAVVK